jgi:hypothetical protein
MSPNWLYGHLAFVATKRRRGRKSDDRSKSELAENQPGPDAGAAAGDVGWWRRDGG